MDREQRRRDRAGRLVEGERRPLILSQPVEDQADWRLRLAAEPLIAVADGGAADRAFQRAELVAARIEGVAAERQIGDLAGRPTRPADELAFGEDAHADAGADGDEDEIALPAAAAAPVLADRGEIDVVFDLDGNAECFGERAAHVEAVEAGDVRRDGDRAAGRLDDSRAAHHRAAQAAARSIRLGNELIGDPADLRHHGPAAGLVGRFDALRHDRAAEIGERDVQFRAAEIDAEHEGGIRLERIGHCSAAHRALNLPDLLDPALALQSAHHLGDRLLGEPRRPAELGAGGCAVPQQPLDDEARRTQPERWLL